MDLDFNTKSACPTTRYAWKPQDAAGRYRKTSTPGHQTGKCMDDIREHTNSAFYQFKT